MSIRKKGVEQVASQAGQKGVVRGLASRAESNRAVVSLNLHDWCFRLARQAPSLMGDATGRKGASEPMLAYA
ncbi:MAG: hypothetical protein HYY45_16225 [Deltaproteobacteria bacterium]|nr:hypothetical protein [Deltaproteobacteria bacterium]